MRIAAFFERLYAGCTAGYLTVWTPDKHTEYFEASKFEEAEVYVQTRAESSDVYFGVGLRRENLGSRVRGGKQDVCSLPGIWLDVDIKGPAHKQANLPETLEQALEVVELCPFEPSVIVHSGCGIHAYWLFDSPLLVEIGKHDGANGAFKRFEKKILEAAKSKFGYDIDSTADISRVLRVPGTYNRKPDLPAPILAEVLLAEDDLIKHNWRKLFSINSVPSPPVPVTDVTVVTEARKRLPKLVKDEKRALMAKVLAGEPFADVGKRDATLQRAAGCAAFVFSPEDAAKIDPKSLAPLFEKSIAAMAAGHENDANPPLTMDDVVEKLSRALSDRVREGEKEKELWAGYNRGNTESAAESTPEDADKPSGFRYTREQIVEFAASQGVTPEQFQKRWVIQHASTYYIFSEGKYLPPVDRESFPVHVFRELSGVPGICLEMLSQGTVRQKPRDDIVKEYGEAAISVRGSFSEAASKYDPDNHTFVEALCVPRKIEPRYYPEIDKWLRLLGGAQAEKLLDWVATVTWLERQSSALYLSGAAGSGKTMLATGLSRIWHRGGPTKLENITGNFNADLFHCPLVFGDESVSCSTTDLRELIGSNSRTLKRKYLSNVFIDGCLRIILADNSGRLLRDHDLAGSDVEAVASKFLNIKVTHEPTDYLRSVGGRKGTDGWVAGDKIAAHALWLVKHRKDNVPEGNRLAVEGDGPTLAQSLVVQGAVSGMLCEWIAKFIDAPQAAILAEGGAVLGGGEIWVSAEIIEKHWSTYIQTQGRQFSVTKIGRALSHISLHKAQISVKAHGKSVVRRMTLVNKEMIYSWAEANLSCDMDEFKAKVEKEVP